MNTLLARGQKLFSLRRGAIQAVLSKKSFSAAGVNAVIGVNQRNVQEAVSSEALLRLIHRDSDYFTILASEKGAEHSLAVLESIGNSVDKSTKYGRDILRFKDEMVTRVAYQNRSIEEHQNLSTHICEKELNKVYREHLKALEKRLENTQKLAEKSTDESQLVYQYDSANRSRYLFSPLLWTFIPASAVLYNKIIIASLFGSFAPSLLVLSSLYLGIRRYKWLTRGEKFNGSTLVRSLTLKGGQIEVVPMLSRSKHTLNVQDVSVQKIENDARTEIYYLIKNKLNHTKFIMPIDESAVANQKLLDWFNNLKNNGDPYSIKNVLVKGDKKVIDTERHRDLKSDLDTVARINILLNYGIDVATFSTRDLYERLYSISDQEVQQYLSKVSESLNKDVLTLEANLVAVEDLLAGFGLSRDEAVKMTHYVKDQFRVQSLQDFKNLASDELARAYNNTVKSSIIDLPTLTNNIEAFFANPGK